MRFLITLVQLSLLSKKKVRDQVSPYYFIIQFAVMVTDLKNSQSCMTITVRTNMNYSVCYYSGATNDRFLSNAFKRCFRLSGVLLKFCRLILGCTKKVYLLCYSRGTWVFSNLLGLFCPFPENLRSYHLSDSNSWPFFSTQNDIFYNPKTTDIKFLISRKLEVTIPFRKSEGIKGLRNR